MSESSVEQLLQQCRSQDVDVKVDAVTKLQKEFEAGSEIPDPDAAITVLRACLRHQNSLLSTATLSCLPHFFPLLATKSTQHRSNAAGSPATSTSSVGSTSFDLPMLRQLLSSFLPSGGLIDRLGESREKARDNARLGLVALGGYAFRASGAALAKSRDGKGQETPLAIFERLVREGGLMSKVWRVREQSIQALVHIRRSHHLFPIRPYLPLLIDALEDSDANVRECAKTSVIELFTGSAVTDGARTDLKKELGKKGVRKGIVDSVLTQVAERANAPIPPPALPDPSGEASPPASEYVPPSMMLMNRKPSTLPGPSAAPRTASASFVPRPASRAIAMSSSVSVPSAVPPTPTESSASDVKVVYIASDRDLESEFAQFTKAFEGKESETNWLDRDRAITRVRGMVKGEAHVRFEETFVSALLHGFIALSFKTLASLRTTVASNTCSLYSELAVALGPALDPAAEQLLSNLINMAGFTKKIIAQQTQATFDTFIFHLSPLPRTVIPLLTRMLADKNPQTRAFVVNHVKLYLEVHCTRARSIFESGGYVDAIEQLVKKGLVDTNPAAREAGRVMFWSFHAVWPTRAAVILNGLDGQARKGVDKACPDPAASSATTALAAGGSTAASGPKKSSVAAAIAASRAKARAIANAPPSLMHQATSTSHAQASSKTTPPLGVISPASSRLPASPPRASRIASSTFRPTSSSAATTTPPRSHTPSAASPPPSPRGMLDFSRSMPRSISTPEKERTSPIAMRRAIVTPLPASPPPPATVVTPPTPRAGLTSRHDARASISSVLGEMNTHPRASTIMPDFMHGDDESLLLASTIPIPDDNDSMDLDNTEHDIDMTFTAHSLGMSTSSQPISNNSLSNGSNTQAFSFSPKSDMSFLPPHPNSLSSKSSAFGSSGPMVEDALRARAEQAESAAERLLELVDADEDSVFSTPPPFSMNVHAFNERPSYGTPTSPRRLSSGIPQPRAPVTPVANRAAVLQRAARFQDSPNNDRRRVSMLDTLRDHQDQSGWWLKRMKLLEPRTASGRSQSLASTSQDEANRYVAALENGSADVDALQLIARSCMTSKEEENSLNGSDAFGDGIWHRNKNGGHLLDGLLVYLTPGKPDDSLEYGLIILWELVDRHFNLLEGREADIFSTLLQVRYSNQANILAATNTIRDALISKVETVYGLTTVHGSLRSFLAQPIPATSSKEAHDTTLAFGLVALGKFILHLPAEILEDELPRLKGTIISAFMDIKAPVVVRESAALTIIAAQNVLRDEAHLFALLDGLPDEKKNLLTYLFDKNGVRGSARSADASKLEREMRRIDGRTSTPMRLTA